jgi:hypothetical protein
MPNFETIHGDEEALEYCSDVWFERLDEHCTGNMGEIDPVSAAEVIDRTCEELLVDYSSKEVHDGYLIAMETFKQRDLLKIDLEPEWPYGEA